ncbi:MAG TPA: ribonuclease HII [Rhodothermales bacterium]|nr:ribonuclease HII [Rhodothermales bacterium]
MSEARNSSSGRSRAPSFAHEDNARMAGYSRIAGADEAGRGCLAGPVVAAAVLLPPRLRIRGVRDSKLLDHETRERLARRIESRALTFAYGVCTVGEIDNMNILRASLLAMRRALTQLIPQPDFVLVDGNQVIHPLPVPQQTVVDGDALCHAIAAASVLAKVKRDAMMRSLEIDFPGYGLAEHKGYATRAHIEAIKALGPAACHRRTFRLTGPDDLQAGFFANA